MSEKSIKFFDQRTVKKNIESGIISQSEYDNFVGNLPDESENYEEIPFEEPEELPFTAEELGLVEPSKDSFSSFSDTFGTSENEEESEINS